MYKIEVYNNHIEINGYLVGENEKLEKYFTIWDTANHCYNYKFISYDSKTRKLYLPRGLDVNFIESTFGGVKAHFNNSSDCDCYIKNETPMMLKHPPRNDKQKETLMFLTGQGKYDYTKNYSQSLIALGTGNGKTYLSIFYMALLNIKTIVITSNKDWLRQWRDEILYHSNIDPKSVHLISGGSEIKFMINRKKEELANRYNIYLVTHATLASFSKQYGGEAIHKLFQHLGIGLKIFDEVHQDFDSVCNVDFHTNTYKTLYLSATPGRGNDEEHRIFKLYFKNVPSIDLFDPEEDPRTNYIAFLYRSDIDPIKLSRCYNFHGFNKMVYADYVMQLPNFYKIIMIIMDVISNIHGKKLFFLATNESIMIFKDWIEANYFEYRNRVGVYTSINSTKKEALNFPIILTTSKSAGAALDIEGLAVTINLLEPTKSKIANQQRLGRTRGKNTFYIDLVDCDNRSCVKYYYKNLPMFDEQCLSVRKIEFDNETLDERSSDIKNRRETVGISPFIKC